MNRGRFITLEGIEGVGKSTHLDFIAAQLETSGHKVLLTREPGGTRLGEAVREILLHGGDLGIEPFAELLLMFSARSQHIEEVIRPVLESGVTVVCDRFTDASYAYQGGGRGIAEERIRTLEKLVQGDLVPDLTLLRDASVETGRRRAASRGRADRFEAEEAAFFDRVRRAYLERAAREPGRVRLVDAEQGVEAVQAQIAALLESA
jgi:dTMP kinase